jgi:uncharacterized protein
MAPIPAEVKETELKCRTWFLATADKKGNPNVVPIGSQSFYSDDVVMFLDNFLGKSKTNILENPRIAITFWEPEGRKGFQIKGTAKIETSGKLFDEELAKWKAGHPTANPHGLVFVKIDEVFITNGGPNAGKKIA